MDYVRQEVGDSVEQYAREPGPWVGCSIARSVAWPEVATSAIFRGQKIVMLPASDRLAPSLAVKIECIDSVEDGMRLLRRFLTALSWVTHPIAAGYWMGGGMFPRFAADASGPRASRMGPLYIPYLPDPANARTWLALALFREGGTLDHVGYSFLSFYKVIESLMPNSKDQMRWINESVERLRGHGVKESIEHVSLLDKDIGRYLYVSGRSAMAHAGGHPIVNPDEVDDETRLYEARPLMTALARYAIESELGVKSLFSLMDAHLYELAGFKDHLDSELVRTMIAGGSIPRRRLPKISPMSFRVWGKDQYRGLENMTIQPLRAIDGVVTLRARSSSGAVEIQLDLNFPQERMNLDPLAGVQHEDTGTALAAREIAESIRFCDDLFGNGHLEVWSAENALLGRKDAYLPVNMFRRPDAASRLVDVWQLRAKEREG